MQCGRCVVYVCVVGGDGAVDKVDWAADQLSGTVDLSITGYPWLDVWLSAGLSPHRVHHLLPYQRSAYANLVSEPVVRMACAKHGIPWHPPRSFISDALPRFLVEYVLARPRLSPRQALAQGHLSWDQLQKIPAAQQIYYPYRNIVHEHLAPTAIMATITHIAKGFAGFAI